MPQVLSPVTENKALSRVVGPGIGTPRLGSILRGNVVTASALLKNYLSSRKSTLEADGPTGQESGLQSHFVHRNPAWVFFDTSLS